MGQRMMNKNIECTRNQKSIKQSVLPSNVRVVLGMLILVLGVLPMHGQVQSSGDAPLSGPQVAASAPELPGNFLRRLFHAYREDWDGSAQSGPEVPRRIPASPLTSPPFPTADWTYGGAPVIGATNVCV